MSGAVHIVQGDALNLPLPDASVDLIVTSPPYAFLRAYDTGYPHLEVGAEATPAEFLEHLWQATAEMVRVLKPTGSIFVDLGDKYGGGVWPNTNGKKNTGLRNFGPKTTTVPKMPARALSQPKSLLLLPERYRIGCVDQLGLIARAVIVWDKPNGLPESVTDRAKRSHEDFVHLTKQPRYYSAIDEIREPHAREWTPGRNGGKARQVLGGTMAGLPDAAMHPLGKLPGSVWSVPSEPLRLPDYLGVQHYAAFPSEWPRRLILGWSPPGICLDCGAGRVPVVERGLEVDHVERQTHGAKRDLTEPNSNGRGFNGETWTPGRSSATILGYACACTPHTNHPGSGGIGDQRRPYSEMLASGDGYATTTGGPRNTTHPGHAGLWDRPKVGPWREYHLDGWKPPPTRPAVILDPFSGVGTTVGVARRLGRIGIGVDLSGSYCRAARWRVNDSDQFGKAESRSWRERQGSLL